MNCFVFIVGCMIIGGALACTQVNVSCDEIKTGSGYKFTYNASKNSEIEISNNSMTKLGHGNQTFSFTSEIKHMDHSSVTTEHCQDLAIKTTIPGGAFVRESCFRFMVNDSGSQTSLSLILGLCLGVPVVLVIGIILCCCLCDCNIRTRQAATTSCGFFGHIKNWSYFRKTGQEEEVGNPNGSELRSIRVDGSTVSQTRGGTPQSRGQNHTESNRGIQLTQNGGTAAPDPNSPFEQRDVNGISRDEPRGENGHAIKDLSCPKHDELPGVPDTDPIPQCNRNRTRSDSEPRGCGEHDTKHLSAPSIDLKTQSQSVDRIKSYERIPPSENGDTGAHDVNGTNDHRDLKRNMRDDPGGIDSKDGSGDQYAEDAVTERWPLLSDHRAALKDPDKTGEAVSLVDKHSFNPDPGRMFSAAAETDVKSAYKDKT
ncbi:uncharacterized protein KZ484_004092 isoform 2-T2 [Pholidichthys leucotaenia]